MGTSIDTSADEATAQLNLATHKLYSWCLANKLTPHPGKSEGMLISRKSPIGTISPILVGGHTIKCRSNQNTLTWVDS